MEKLRLELDNSSVLERNARYLDNISSENRPIALNQEDWIRLDGCIFDAADEIFGISRDQIVKGRKVEDEVGARRAVAQVFRTLTNYSNEEIGYRLGAWSSAGEYLRRSKILLQTDLYYSAFVLTTAIRAYGRFYPAAQNPTDIVEIIQLAKRRETQLPILKVA